VSLATQRRQLAVALPRPSVRGVSLSALPVLVVGSAVAGSLYGTVAIPGQSVLLILLQQLGWPGIQHFPAWEVSIVWQTRFPEVVTALLVGGALATAGALFQAILRNPLADPFVIGTASGASLGVAIATVTSFTAIWMGFGAMQLFAFGGAVLAVALVYGLGRVGGRTPTVTLLLAGFAVSTLMIAAMWLVAYEGGGSQRLLSWTMGSLAASSWSQLGIVGPLLILSAGLTLLFTRDLNAMLLGEAQAAHLGVETERVKLLILGIATLLTALAVSLSGIIGFVGLVVPHVGRLIYGSDHRLLLPASICLGGIYLTLADLGARTLQAGGGELPLGILTAFIGAPFFLFLLRRSGDAYRF